MVIHNSNGKDYVVLDSKGSYTLLERTTEGISRYVVAWLLTTNDNNISTWGQGHYFESLKSAKAYFDTK
jgi:myo-inositol-hexaphosphate 3-phosphohydrolase